MNIYKTSEKLLIFMHRNGITQQQLANNLNTYRQDIAMKLKNNIFTVDDILNLKKMGFNE